MAKITYQIVKHDGGWAYKVDETFSESFRTHDEARKAAELAAREQAEPGDATVISYEDKEGHWHKEKSTGDDRPEADVEGWSGIDAMRHMHAQVLEQDLLRTVCKLRWHDDSTRSVHA